MEVQSSTPHIMKRQLQITTPMPPTLIYRCYTVVCEFTGCRHEQDNRPVFGLNFAKNSTTNYLRNYYKSYRLVLVKGDFYRPCTEKDQRSKMELLKYCETKRTQITLNNCLLI